MASTDSARTTRPRDLESVARGFAIYGDFVSGTPYGSGHINETYCVVFNQAGTAVRYIFQRVNDHIFRDVPALMENITRVLAHQRQALAASARTDGTRRAMSLVPARNGSDWFQDDTGGFWRVYLLVEGARTYDIVESPAVAEAAAAAFGAFQAMLADLPAPRLHETIPAFHDTPERYRALEAAIRGDTQGRAAGVAEEIAFARARGEAAQEPARLQAAGVLPERVTHNDTKINNVLIDDATGEGICVIDLDTVMPGLVLYDFGDMARSACNSAAEDERDLGRVHFRMDIFEALVRGYRSAAGAFLVPSEIERLPFAARLMTLECGVRFLTDYLAGDRYFRIHHATHNLDRCRTQFHLVRLMEQQQDAMQRIVARYD